MKRWRRSTLMDGTLPSVYEIVSCWRRCAVESDREVRLTLGHLEEPWSASDTLISDLVVSRNANIFRCYWQQNLLENWENTVSRIERVQFIYLKNQRTTANNSLFTPLLYRRSWKNRATVASERSNSWTLRLTVDKQVLRKMEMVRL
jgi:hypothetical protein